MRREFFFAHFFSLDFFCNFCLKDKWINENGIKEEMKLPEFGLLMRFFWRAWSCWKVLNCEGSGNAEFQVIIGTWESLTNYVMFKERGVWNFVLITGEKPAIVLRSLVY